MEISDNKIETFPKDWQDRKGSVHIELNKVKEAIYKVRDAMLKGAIHYRISTGDMVVIGTVFDGVAFIDVATHGEHYTIMDMNSRPPISEAPPLSSDAKGGKDIFDSHYYEGTPAELDTKEPHKVILHFRDINDYQTFLNWWVLGKKQSEAEGGEPKCELCNDEGKVKTPDDIIHPCPLCNMEEE